MLPQNMFFHILYENEEIITYLRADQTIDSWESRLSLFTLRVQQKILVSRAKTATDFPRSSTAKLANHRNVGTQLYTMETKAAVTIWT